MRLKFPFPLSALCFLLFCSGCTVLHYQNAETRFDAWSLFDNDKLTKLSLDRRGKLNSQGLSLGAFSSQVDDAAIEAITKGVTEALIKSLIPLP